MSPSFERLSGRAVLDPAFRKQLLDDPDGTVQNAGFSLTAQELRVLHEVAKDRAGSETKLNALAHDGFWL